MTDTAAWIAALTGPGALGIIVLIAFLRGWVVPGSAYRREQERADRYLSLLEGKLGQRM